MAKESCTRSSNSSDSSISVEEENEEEERGQHIYKPRPPWASSSRNSILFPAGSNGRRKSNIVAIARSFTEMPAILQHGNPCPPTRPSMVVKRSSTRVLPEEHDTRSSTSQQLDTRTSTRVLAEKLDVLRVAIGSAGSIGVSGRNLFTRTLRRRLLILLEEPFGSCAAWFLSSFFISTNSVALGLLCSEHVVLDSTLAGGAWGKAMVIVSSIGTLEAALRFACAPRRRRILGHTANVIDGSCVIAFWLFRVLRLDLTLELPSLFLLRRMEFWLRLLKLCRYFNNWYLLYLAITEAMSALILPLVALAFIMGIGACTILIAEEAAKLNGETDDSAIVGFPSALRFVLLCVIAIAPGPFYDLELMSKSAKLSVGFLMMSGLVVFAMPMSIVGTCFCQVWFQRHRLLFIEGVRRRVERETLEDTKQKLRLLFDSFTNGDSELGIAEFRDFARSVLPNISADNVRSIYVSLDQDQNGSLSFQEVHAAVFPEDATLEFLLEPSGDTDQEIEAAPSGDNSSERGALEGLRQGQLESWVRVLERRQQQTSLPPWCQAAYSLSSLGYRGVQPGSIGGSRRSSQSSNHVQSIGTCAFGSTAPALVQGHPKDGST